MSSRPVPDLFAEAVRRAKAQQAAPPRTAQSMGRAKSRAADGAPPALTIREKDVERRCDSLMTQLGWTAIRFSQARASQQTEGIPDRRYYHAGRGLALWFECKRPGGKQRAAQRDFQRMCEACGERYVLGGVDELRAAVIAVTIAPTLSPSSGAPGATRLSNA